MGGLTLAILYVRTVLVPNIAGVTNLPHRYMSSLLSNSVVLYTEMICDDVLLHAAKPSVDYFLDSECKF